MYFCVIVEFCQHVLNEHAMLCYACQLFIFVRMVNNNNTRTINQSINQSKHISIAPYVASESEAHIQSVIIYGIARCESSLGSCR